MITPLRRIHRLLATLFVAGVAAAATAHPQDGPHADVRIRLDDRVLRWNIGLNLAYMDEIVDVGRERIDAIAPVEEEILRDAVLEHLVEDNRVVIDGREVEPTIIAWNFRRGDPTLLPLFPRAGMRGLIRVEVILDYPHEGDPQQLELTWADFPLDVLSAELEGGEPAPLVLQAQLQAEGVIELIEFSEGIPTVTWHATGQTIEQRLRPVPDLADAIAMAGMGAPPEPAGVRPDAEGGGGGPAPPPTRAGAPAPDRTTPPTRTPVERDGAAPVGRGLPLGGFVLAAVGVFCGALALLPSRPTSARALGGTLAVVLLGVGAWWVVAGPGVATAPMATRSLLARADAGVGATDIPGATSPPVTGASAGTATGAPGQVTESACIAVFHPLLMNVYTAFDYSEESDVYDTLAYSVDGDLLDALYRRIHRGLVMDDHDRAVARVTGVELLEAEVADPGAALTEGRFDVTARWRVDGTVVHWGHAHIRIHEYAARYAVARTDRGWRIVDQLMLEQQRIPNPADPLEQGVTVTLPTDLEL